LKTLEEALHRIPLPPLFLNKREKQQKHATQEKKNLVQAFKVRANLTSGREVYPYQDRKAAARRAFSIIPMKYLQNFLKITRETIGIKKMVP
jgi:hypothetical protein